MGTPELKQELEELAKKEGRSTSNLCERLLAWSVEQLRAAGDSNTLVKWRAMAPDVDLAEQVAMERRVSSEGLARKGKQRKSG